jgi:hypothetical protein
MTHLIRSHEHEVVHETVHPWTRCICPETAHSEAAHGNVILMQSCACGAVRLVEANRSWQAAGEWLQPEEAA